MRWLIGPLVMLLVVAAAGPAAAGAGSPSEHLRVQIERALKTLEDPELKKAGRGEERRQAVRRIAEDIFDFAETAKRALARHWAGRTPAEREEFVTLFSGLLERSYISRIELFDGERVSFVDEAVEGDQAVVRSRIVTRQGAEIPVDYRMLRRGERWLVWDVVIEGVSLVDNYRSQFNKIIQISSYQELVRKLRSKQGEPVEPERGRRTSRTLPGRAAA